MVEDASAEPLPLELHLNLWEVEGRFLDVGIMIPAESAATRIQFLLPWEQPKGSAMADLSSWLADSKSVAAIFNETWVVQDQQANWPVTRRVLDHSQNLLFAIVNCGGYLAVQPHVEGHLVSLNVAQMRADIGNLRPCRLYVRFRVPSIPASFYEVGLEDQDRGWKSSWSRTEIIEVRLNVRRGTPVGLETGNTKLALFSKVHLFLMRERSKELVYEDRQFMACRSLEDETYWSQYTRNGASRGADVSSIRNSIGYQWTKRGKERSFEEFAIVARFKSNVVSIRAFLITALLLGALGSGLWDGLKWGLMRILGG